MSDNATIIIYKRKSEDISSEKKTFCCMNTLKAVLKCSECMCARVCPYMSYDLCQGSSRETSLSNSRHVDEEHLKLAGTE